MHRNYPFARAGRERVLVMAAMAALTTAWLGAHSAHAQQQCTRDMTDQQKKENAVTWWQQGTRLYEQKRYRESIDSFQQAYGCATLLPTSDKATKTAANFLFNIAQAHRQLGECGPAVERYKRYLEMTHSLDWDEQVREIRAAVTVTLDELEQTCPAPEDVRPPAEIDPPAQASGKDDGAPEARGHGTDTAVREDQQDVTGTRRGNGADAAARFVSMSIGVGPAFLGMGDISVPTQLSYALRIGHPMRAGAVDIEVGGAFTYTPVPWRHDEEISGTASLWSVLLDAGVSAPILDRWSARADVGLGVLNFSGLDVANPFTMHGAEPSGPLTMFNARLELGLVYALTPHLVVNASPVVFSYSPADRSLTDVIGSLTRYELLIGAGYRR